MCIEMNGEIVPVREIVTPAHGIHYEVFDPKKPDKKGYPVEWEGERWIFEKGTSTKMSYELYNFLTNEVTPYKNVPEKLSIPDSMGLRWSDDGESFIKADNEFYKVKPINNGGLLYLSERQSIAFEFSFMGKKIQGWKLLSENNLEGNSSSKDDLLRKSAVKREKQKAEKKIKKVASFFVSNRNVESAILTDLNILAREVVASSSDDKATKELSNLLIDVDGGYGSKDGELISDDVRKDIVGKWLIDTVCNKSLPQSIALRMLDVKNKNIDFKREIDNAINLNLGAGSTFSADVTRNITEYIKEHSLLSAISDSEYSNPFHFAEYYAGLAWLKENGIDKSKIDSDVIIVTGKANLELIRASSTQGSSLRKKLIFPAYLVNAFNERQTEQHTALNDDAQVNAFLSAYETYINELPISVCEEKLNKWHTKKDIYKDLGDLSRDDFIKKYEIDPMSDDEEQLDPLEKELHREVWAKYVFDKQNKAISSYHEIISKEAFSIALSGMSQESQDFINGAKITKSDVTLNAVFIPDSLPDNFFELVPYGRYENNIKVSGSLVTFLAEKDGKKTLRCTS